MNKPQDSFGQAGNLYQRIRPSYPLQSLAWIAQQLQHASRTEISPHKTINIAEVATNPSTTLGTPTTSTKGQFWPPTVVDIGAGTGKLTRQLLELGWSVTAVEPAAGMVEVLRTQLPQICIQPYPAEQTNLPANSADLATFGQSWHWVDPAATAVELSRILRPRAMVAILFNQLDVSVAWVHRLTRIMRSGDVHRRSDPPQLTEKFTKPQLHVCTWNQELTPEEIEYLGATRSSFLGQDDKGKERMRTNLRWYLYEYLGFVPGQKVCLPYETLTWVATLRPIEYPNNTG